MKKQQRYGLAAYQDDGTPYATNIVDTLQEALYLFNELIEQYKAGEVIDGLSSVAIYPEIEGEACRLNYDADPVQYWIG